MMVADSKRRSSAVQSVSYVGSNRCHNWWCKDGIAAAMHTDNMRRGKPWNDGWHSISDWLSVHEALVCSTLLVGDLVNDIDNAVINGSCH